MVLIQQAHRIMHNNLVKNINVITNLIDVTLTTNHFHRIGIHYISQVMVLHHFIIIIIIIIIIINFWSYVYWLFSDIWSTWSILVIFDPF